MRMTTFRRIGTGLVIALILLALPRFITIPGFAQTTVTQTTLAAAVSAPAQGSPSNQIQVSSATGIVAATATSPATELFVDQEAMLVTAVNGTTVTVLRGYDGTATVGHASGAVVYEGPTAGVPGSPFVFTNPPLGTCTLTNELYSLRINTRTGQIWACSSAGWRSQYGSAPVGFYSGQASGTTVTTLTAAQSGSTFLFDAASGNNYKLPPPVAGLSFDFIQTTTVSSNSAEIQTDGSSTFIQGAIHIGGVATTLDFACNGTSHVAIKQNGTTTGGILGGRLHFIAVSGTKWQVDGLTVGSGTGATPCSTTT